MKAAKIVAGVISLGVTLPIWLYLLYKLLENGQATELMWFLYWIYVPASVVVGVITRAILKTYE